MPDFDLSAHVPAAGQRPAQLELHGDVRVDEYHWLRRRDDPEVIAHLEAENAYTAGVTAPLAKLRERLYGEIVGRVQETDTSAPQAFRGWWYYSRTVEGLQYGIHCRKRGSLEAPEQVFLDENAEAEGLGFYRLGVFDISPDQRLAAHAHDSTGAEKYSLRFRDLDTGADLGDRIEGVYYSSAWSADSTWFFYTRPDAAMRPYQVWRHRIGTAQEQDVLVHQEDDERFFIGVELTKSERFILIGSHSQTSSEVQILPAGDPESAPTLFSARTPDLEYSPDHQGDRFLILTNADGALGFKVMAAPEDAPGRENWTEVVPHRSGVRLNALDVYRNHVVLGQRGDGLQRLEILDTRTGALSLVPQPEPTYTAYPGSNPEYGSTTMRFFYTSLTTPASSIDYEMDTGERTLVKQQPVRGGYDSSNYQTERIWATAADGVRVPISMVWRRGLKPDGSNPCLLYGYGSYESSSDPIFSSARLTLLDRGFVYAIAHVREAARWAAGGTRAANTCTSATPSQTSWPRPKLWYARAGRHPIASLSGAAARAGSWWGRRSTCAQTYLRAWWLRCRSSTW